MTIFTRFTLKQKRGYVAIFPIVLIAVLILFFVIEQKISTIAITSATAASAGFTHFLYLQHNHNTKIFIELFKEFNERYDSLNDELNKILLTSESLESPQIQTLYDYFNLCAEEYLFYKAGFIDENIWQSWNNGMKNFAKDQRICELWEKELKNNSYYGFEI